MSDVNPPQAHVNRFLETIAPWAHSYDYSGFSYLAVRSNEGWTLLHGRLFLRSQAIEMPGERFETEHVIAGHVPLEKSNDGYAALVNSLSASGAFEHSGLRLRLRRYASIPASCFYQPFHPEGLTAQNRLPVLLIQGASRHGLLEQPAIDWELRAAAVPYDSLAELATAYWLGNYTADSTAIEIIAQPVVSVAADSRVSATGAELAILISQKLDPAKCRLGYRVIPNKGVVTRGSLAGHQLTWQDNGAFRRGVAQLDVPQGAVLHCYASYAGCVQNHFWIADPSHFQNPMRMTLLANDPDLAVLRDYLFEERRSRKESRDFEHGVSMLAWMLGFNVVQIGSTPRLTDAPDIAATTPKGDLLLIECTVGLLKADSKLQRLIERTRAVRSSLDASGNRHVRLLPIMVTALEREAVEVDIASANDAGVGVVTRETLQDLLGRTFITLDAQKLFDESWIVLQSPKNNAAYVMP